MPLPHLRMVVLAGCVVATSCSHAAGGLAGDSATSARIDAMLSQTFEADGPGAAVIASKDGKVAFRKAYGLANLETRTAMRPEMVFEIGSLTKQFTSTAVLMLAEQGKLSLTDDVRKYLPEFPDKGVVITVEHLLTHTSGIKSYTDDPKWLGMWRQDLTPAQVIDLTRDAPLEFTPGTKWNYNNTGYTMLGAIIEKASGVAYADFVRRHMFEPVGMSQSLYGSFSALIPNRASGYTRGATGWENAPYLSMTQPYAAGALMSSVDDMMRWDEAVSSGRLLSKASWARAFTGFKLASGEDTGYGYGWQLGAYEGHLLVHHAGGIPGYSSAAVRMPSDRIYVVVLANSDDPPAELDFIAVRIGGELTGKPYREPRAAQLPVPVLDSYVGVYRINESATRTISREGTRMFMQRTGAPKLEITASAEGEFFVKRSSRRLSFLKDGSGRITGLVMDHLGWREAAQRAGSSI